MMKLFACYLIEVGQKPQLSQNPYKNNYAGYFVKIHCNFLFEYHIFEEQIHFLNVLPKHYTQTASQLQDTRHI